MPTSRFVPALRALSSLLLLGAASTAGAQQLPPIRPLGATVAKTTETFGNVNGVRHLPGGKVLVNDPAGRRLLMLDSSLAVAGVVADSTPATGTAYSGRVAGLIPFRGDSSLFIDAQSLSMLVIDPNGKLGRVMSVPRSEDAFSLTGFQGMPGFDAQGRLIYRSTGFRSFARPAGGAAMAAPVFPDSAPLLRVDLATRKMDTVAHIKIPKVTMNVSQDDNGRMTMSSVINPLPVVDEWAVLADGSVAVVRGRDYHVDLYKGAGAVQSAAKLPFEWQRLSDEDKVALIDSVKAMRGRMAASGAPSGGGQVMMTMSMSAAGSGASRGEGERVIRMGPGGEAAPPPRTQQGSSTAATMTAPTPPQLNFVAPSELPDYKPPFFSNAVRADADGNLWIRTIPTKAYKGGPIYDVVNAKGELVDRVQIPEGRTIVGFGPGTAYLLVREGTTARLERARVR